MSEIVEQRVDLCIPEIRVGQKIGLAIKEWAGAPALPGAKLKIVDDRIDAGGIDIRVLRKIPM